MRWAQDVGLCPHKQWRQESIIHGEMTESGLFLKDAKYGSEWRKTGDGEKLRLPKQQ